MVRSTPDEVSGLLAQARMHLVQDDLDQARQALERLVELDPQHAEARTHLTFLRYRSGDRAALQSLRDAAASPNANAFELLDLARALALAGEGVDAGAAFNRAALLEPSNTFLRKEAGETALGRGDAPAALRHYQAAVASAPDQYRLRVFLAKAHVMAGELDLALDQLFVAIELAPEESAVHEEMFLLCERMGAFPEAYREAEWLSTRFPDNLRYLYWTGISLMRVGLLVEARPILEQVVSLSSRSAEARQALAVVYFRLQDLPRAQSLLEEARKMDPASAAVAIDLGKVYLAQGRPAESEDVLNAALRLHPESNALHYHLALALAKRDPAAAIEHVRRATFAEDFALQTEAEQLLAELTRPKEE